MPIFNRAQLRRIFTPVGPHVGDDVADVLEEGVRDLASKQDIEDLDKNVKEGLAGLEKRFNEKLAAMETRFNEKLTVMDERFNEKLATMEERFNERLGAMESRIEAKFYRAMFALAAFFIALYGATVGLMIAFG